MKRSLSGPRIFLRVDAVLILVGSVVLYAQTGAGWGMFALLLFAPDIAMLGYLAGPRIGALCYNLGHSLAGPTVLAALGVLGQVPVALPIGLIWFAHIGLDHAIGYGFKYASGFKDTHLQRV